MAILTDYRNVENRPRVVEMWEGRVNGAAGHDEAQTQLLYSLTVQVYKIRILLAFGLFVVPASLAVATIVILAAMST